MAIKTLGIDKTHSEVNFQVRHLVTRVRGQFGDFDGTIQFDETNPEQSSVTFTIQAASIDTNVADRDAHLRSEDFFFVEQFPTLSFTSTGITKTGAESYNVAGTLTIRGVSRDITLPVTYLGTANDPWGNAKVGFEAETTINRKDYGLTWNAALETGGFLVGEEVKISLSLQAMARQA